MRLDRTIFVEASPCKTFCTITVYIFNEVIKFTTRNTCITRYYDTFNYATIVDNRTEYFKFCIFYKISYISKGHVKTKVWFIRTIFIHCFIPCNARHRQCEFFAQCSFKYMSNHFFKHGVNVFFIYEGHFQVELSELWLTVCTQIFIAEATNDLEIFFITSYHQDLFENLWRLWQCIECTSIYTRRY